MKEFERREKTMLALELYSDEKRYPDDFIVII